MRSAADGAAALREALLAEGGTLAAALDGVGPGSDSGQVAASDSGPGPAQLAAAGPRAAGLEADYELLLEMILEGSRLHYGAPRVVRTDDSDLALLLGDQLYALGLARLAGLGDIAAVTELADVISLVAQAHAAANTGLAEAAWEAGAAAIGWGGGSDHELAKDLARAGDHRAAQALRDAAAARFEAVARDPRRDLDDNLKSAFN